MKSESDLHELFAKTKSHFEKLPKIRGRTTSVDLIGSRVVIKTRRKYDEENEPHDVIEFDEGLIDLEGLMDLGNRVRHLAMETPKPSFYADSWLKMSQMSPIDSGPLTEKLPSEEDVSKFINSLPNSIQVKLKMRNDPNKLFMQLFQAKNIFEPLIFIESGLIKDKNGTGYKFMEYVDDKKKLVKSFNTDMTTYKTTIESLNLFDYLYSYLQSLDLCCKTKISNIYCGISRANYAFMLMVLSCLPDDIKKLAMFNCISYLRRHKKEKPTKISIHTLSRIIYGLLIEHATDKTPKGRAYCYGFTAQILTAFSPKKDNGEPYYSIDERGVEYALTGK